MIGPARPGAANQKNRPEFLPTTAVSEPNNNYITAMSRGRTTMNARNFFFFDSMLTPKFITIIYWLGLIAVVFTGLGSLFMMGFQYVTFGGFVRALFITIGGAVVVRVYCELMIVLFKINENVQKIADSKPKV